MLSLNKSTNVLEEEVYRYTVQDVREPELYRDIFPYTEIPRTVFNHRRVPMKVPEHIWITDTTFRDGQQSRAPYTVKQIVDIYKMLHRLGGEKGIIRFGRERAESDELLLANRRQVFFLSPDSIESSPYLECSLDMSDELLELEDTNFDVIAVELYSSDDAYHFARNASMANLPVMFRSDDEMALKAALLCYQGRAMIDRSCSINEDRLHRIAGKYGAVVY